jgi:2'-5' RNA ligase
MSRSKTRTFIAIEANDEVRVRALQAIDRLSRDAENVKWVAPDNLHWTLQFLGDISYEQMAEACRIVGKVAARHKPFVLTATGVGAFPKIDRPRTLWLGAGQGGDQLCTLQSVLEEGLAELGFRGENRRYVPHLTLGRLARGSHGGQALAAGVAELSNFEGGAMEVDEVTVFASVLEREGPTYHVLSHAPLGG